MTSTTKYVHASTVSGRAAARTRLHRRRVVWSELSAAEREALVPELHRVFAHAYVGVDRRAFEAFFLSREGVVLGLFRDASQELRGFVVDRLTLVETRRGPVGVFSAGVYFTPGCAGGPLAARFGLEEALRAKLRRPTLPLGYLAIAHTPAPYRLYARTMPRVVPSRAEHSGEPGAFESELIRQALDKRGWPRVAGSAWVVETPFEPNAPQRLRERMNMNDADVRFFVERVPRWDLGHGLAVWMPLSLRDVFAGLAKASLATLRRTFSSASSK